MIDVLQLILVEPDARRLGWGVVKFVGFLQVWVEKSQLNSYRNIFDRFQSRMQIVWAFKHIQMIFLFMLGCGSDRRQRR